MLLSQALDAVHKFTPQEFAALSDLLSPELIDPCLANTGVATLRKALYLRSQLSTCLVCRREGCHR